MKIEFSNLHSDKWIVVEIGNPSFLHTEEFTDSEKAIECAHILAGAVLGKKFAVFKCVGIAVAV